MIILNIANRIESTVSIGIGSLVWHGGERIVQLATGDSNTVLSSLPHIQNIVYRSIGITCLAAGMVFIPVAAIQMIALPIILGSIYGTINNQFTVRDCPEYYTMGHSYDGTRLEGHAIKTNNLLIKPIVTGCYATTMVTKFMGLVIAAAGTLPYTSMAIPVPYVATMIIGVLVISLVTAHIFARIRQRAVQNDLATYATLIGYAWTEKDRDLTWDIFRTNHPPTILETTNLARRISSYSPMPIKYIAGWETNNRRNSVGYAFAGGGTIVLTISIIFLRIFVLRA